MFRSGVSHSRCIDGLCNITTTHLMALRWTFVSIFENNSSRERCQKKLMSCYQCASSNVRNRAKQHLLYLSSCDMTRKPTCAIYMVGPVRVCHGINTGRSAALHLASIYSLRNSQFLKIEEDTAVCSAPFFYQKRKHTSDSCASSSLVSQKLKNFFWKGLCLSGARNRWLGFSCVGPGHSTQIEKTAEINCEERALSA